MSLFDCSFSKFHLIEPLSAGDNWDLCLSEKMIFFHETNLDLKKVFNREDYSGKLHYLSWIFNFGVKSTYRLDFYEVCFLENALLKSLSGFPVSAWLYFKLKSLGLSTDLDKLDKSLEVYLNTNWESHFFTISERNYIFSHCSREGFDIFGDTNWVRFDSIKNGDLRFETDSLPNSLLSLDFINTYPANVLLNGLTLRFFADLYTRLEQGLRLNGNIHFEWNLTSFEVSIGAKVYCLPNKSNVSIVGFAQSELGIGEDARTVSASLELVGTSVSVFSLIPDIQRPAKDQTVSHLLDNSISDKFLIFNLPPLETVRYSLELSNVFDLSRVMKIGYWPWEFSGWLPELRFCEKFVDEVWCPTQFIKEAFQSWCSIPVVHMPLPVSLPSFQFRNKDFFGINNGAFAFLYVFDSNSSIARKNPRAAIESFKKAFVENESVCLVLKCINGNTNSPEFEDLLRTIGDDKRIKVINESFRRDELVALINACDCYVSLHRSEGFGRTIAEAMLLSKPVIVTGYSGNMDYCTNENSLMVGYNLLEVTNNQYNSADGFFWADPSIEEASSRFAWVFKNKGKAEEIGKKGMVYINSRYSLEACGRRMSQRLSQIGLKR